MIDSIGTSEDHLGFYRYLLQHAHEQECVALAYCLTVYQCAVSGKGIFCGQVVRYVLRNVGVDRKDLFEVALTGEVQLSDDRIELRFEDRLLSTRGVIFDRIGQRVVIGAVLRILIRRCRVTLNAEERIGI